MKTAKFDLATAIFMLVVGGLFAFVLCSFLLPQIKDETFLKLDGIVSDDVGVPDEEIFNTESINPTVEVCVGCTGFEGTEEVEEPVEEE